MAIIAPKDASNLAVRLRAETAAEHQRTEELLAIMAPGLTRAGYRRKLEQLWGFWAPLEERLAAHAPAFLEAGLDFESRRRQPLLEEDLRVLGEAAPRALPSVTAERLPRTDSLAAAFGALYVLEGATLGGQFIAKKLGPALELAADHGLAFFMSGGAPVGPRWNAFKEALLGNAARAGDAEETVHAARETFQKLGAWLESSAGAR